MVSAIIKMFSKKVDGIGQAAFFIGFFILLSQILGLIRDRMLAYYVGPGEILDIYYIAFRVPDILFVTVASLISVASVIPHFTEKFSAGKNRDEAKKLLDSLFTFFVIFLILVGFLVFIFMPHIISFIVPSFSEQKILEVAKISRIMLASPFLLGISNLFGSVTQYFRRFVVFGLSSVLYNFGIIIGILFFYPIFRIAGLAFGVVLGGFLHLLIQVPVLIQEKMFPWFTKEIDWGGVQKVVYSSLPRTLALSFSSITMIALVSMATNITPGSVSLLQFSYNLQSVPLSIIGMSFSVATFPALASAFVLGDTNQFNQKLSLSLKQIIFWSLPTMALFIILRSHIVRVILGTNNFTWENTKVVAASFSLFIISVFAQSMVMLLSRAFYATKKTIWPLLCNGFSSVFIVIISSYFIFINEQTSIYLFLTNLFKINSTVWSPLIMLSFSFSLGSFLNLLLLFWASKKYLNFNFGKILSTSFLKVLFASIFSAIIAYLVLYFSAPVFGLKTLLEVFLQGLFAGFIGIISFVLLQEVFGCEEYKSVKNILKKKISGKPDVAPEITLN